MILELHVPECLVEITYKMSKWGHYIAHSKGALFTFLST